MTDAALTLLASDWAGDLVALVGDNFSFSEDEGYLIKIEGLNRPGVVAFCESTKDGPYEYAMGYFLDVAGQFACAEGAMRWLREDEYDGQESSYVPYDGPFCREPTHYRFVANDTRKEYVDREAYQQPGSAWQFDPFPLLMATGWGYLDFPDGTEACGAWVGEKVRPCHEPPDGYADGMELYRAPQLG